MRIHAILLSLAALSAGAVQASAATNLVKNGDFELTSSGGNKQLASINDLTDSGGGRTKLLYWDSKRPGIDGDSGYNFVLDSTKYTTNQSAIALRTQNDSGVANGITASPAGGNVFASDPQYYVAALSQSITGLTANSVYTLTFSYALAQQSGFNTANVDAYWGVTLGDSAVQTTDKLTIESGGFSGWKTATMTFTANAGTELLTFLANGGTYNAPPFLLLDGVSLTAAVPEPETWGMLLGGLGLIGYTARRRAARKQA